MKSVECTSMPRGLSQRHLTKVHRVIELCSSCLIRSSVISASQRLIGLRRYYHRFLPQFLHRHQQKETLKDSKLAIRIGPSKTYHKITCSWFHIVIEQPEDPRFARTRCQIRVYAMQFVLCRARESRSVVSVFMIYLLIQKFVSQLFIEVLNKALDHDVTAQIVSDVNTTTQRVSCSWFVQLEPLDKNIMPKHTRKTATDNLESSHNMTVSRVGRSVRSTVTR